MSIPFYRSSDFSKVPQIINVKVLVTQACPTLCNPMDYSSPGSLVHGILQERILEWVAFLFSSRFSQPRDLTGVSLIAGEILYQLSHQGSPRLYKLVYKSLFQNVLYAENQFYHIQDTLICLQKITSSSQKNITCS